MEMMIPEKEHMTDSAAEHMVTLRKLLNSLIADSAGKMTSAEIKSEPTRFIARTMMTAMTSKAILKTISAICARLYPSEHSS